MVTMSEILSGRPQPFRQPQNPMQTLAQPINANRTAMARALLEDSNGAPRNLLEGIAQGITGFAGGRMLKKQDQEMADRRSAMAQALGAKDISIDEIERMGILSGDESLLEVAKMRRAAEAKAEPPASVQEYEYGLKNPGFMDWKKKGGGGEFGLNLVYGTDANGNTVAFQTSKGGGLRPVEYPNGVKPAPGMSFQDMGTYILPVNTKTGERGDPLKKEVAGAETEKAHGKGIGEARANLPVVEGAANMMLGSIDSLMNDPYLPSMVGPWAGKYAPNVTADAHRVQSKMDQIGGQSFLQAYNTLKGGGQITEVEGKKATDAINRLNTAQSYEDYVAALGELRDIVNSVVTRARNQAAGNAAPQVEPDEAGSGFKEGDYFDSETDIPEDATVVDDDGNSFKKVNGKLVPVQ